MATTNSYQVSRAQWLVDWANSPRDLGHQIDWASVDPARVDAVRHSGRGGSEWNSVRSGDSPQAQPHLHPCRRFGLR